MISVFDSACYDHVYIIFCIPADIHKIISPDNAEKHKQTNKTKQHAEQKNKHAATVKRAQPYKNHNNTTAVQTKHKSTTTNLFVVTTI